MKKLLDIPHLFAKLMVLWCVACGTAASAYSLRILARTGHDPAALLVAILTFFGGELLMICLKTVLKGGKDDRHDRDRQGDGSAAKSDRHKTGGAIGGEN